MERRITAQNRRFKNNYKGRIAMVKQCRRGYFHLVKNEDVESHLEWMPEMCKLIYIHQ